MWFPTTVVGGYPQPDWLIDREKLSGMKYLPRVVADGKLRAMVEGARILRAEFARG